MKVHEIYEIDLQHYFLKNNTQEGHYIVVYTPNLHKLCGEIEKRLDVQFTALDEVSIGMIKYDTFGEALKAYAIIIDLDELNPEIWSNGRRKRKTRK